MKRILSLLLALALSLTFAGCATGGTETGPSTVPAPTEQSITPENCNTKWDGKTLKVLSVGNSFARNANQELYNIAKAHGVEAVVVGVLHIPGCTVKTHWQKAQSGEAAYIYYKYSDAGKQTTENVTLMHGLLDEDWDVITITQGGGLYGIPSSYDGCLENLIAHLNANKTNPDGQIAFHMTWAFPKDSTIARFQYYDNDQDLMFQRLTETARDRIMSLPEVDFLLPSGTAIQNMRTVMGDIFSDSDRFHLNSVGEYVAGYCWFAYLTGKPIDQVLYLPSTVPSSEKFQRYIREAVNGALDSTYTVTELQK